MTNNNSKIDKYIYSVFKYLVFFYIDFDVFFYLFMF